MNDHSGPLPVVLVHGIRVSGSMWGPVADVLTTHRPVATPDLPGHGRRRGEPFTLDAAVDAVRDAVGAVGGRALLVGHSLGGGVATLTAARHPGTVAGLVGIGCTFPVRTPVGHPLRLAYRAMAWFFEHRTEQADRLSARAFRRLLPPDVTAATLSGGFSGACVPEVLAAVAVLDGPREIARYPGPVWLVNGGLDQFRVAERAWLAACRDGRLSVWPGLNHISIMGQVTRLATLVDDACAVAEHPSRSLQVS
jgi:pimeloyl-ACP methyl ester carboxylesterase